MSVTTPPPAAGGYTTTAKVFHWLVAIAVLGMIPIGLVLNSLPQGPIQDAFYAMHKSTGIVVGALMIGRLIWRLMTPPPPPEPTLERWQIGASHAVHWTLYLLLLVMPIVGWAGSNAFGAPVSVYGLFEMPNLLSKDEDLSKRILAVHAIMGIIVALLVLVHISAVIFHRFVQKDAVLARMTTAPAINPRR